MQEKDTLEGQITVGTIVRLSSLIYHLEQARTPWAPVRREDEDEDDDDDGVDYDDLLGDDDADSECPPPRASRANPRAVSARNAHEDMRLASMRRAREISRGLGLPAWREPQLRPVERSPWPEDNARLRSEGLLRSFPSDPDLAMLDDRNRWVLDEAADAAYAMCRVLDGPRRWERLSAEATTLRQAWALSRLLWWSGLSKDEIVARRRALFDGLPPEVRAEAKAADRRRLQKIKSTDRYREANAAAERKRYAAWRESATEAEMEARRAKKSEQRRLQRARKKERG